MTEDRPTGGPRRPRVSRFLCLAAGLALLFPGCATAPAPKPLSHAFESPEALARVVLDALAARDQATLGALPLSATEFRQIVWPELPSSRPEVNLPVEYAWGDLSTKSRGHLGATLDEWGGRRLALVRLEFRGDTTAYKTFSVHRDAQLTVRTDTGEERRIRLFGSILERDGQFKLFSYVVD